MVQLASGNVSMLVYLLVSVADPPLIIMTPAI